MKGVFCFPQNFKCILPWNGMYSLEWDVMSMHKISLWFRIVCTTWCNQCNEGLYIWTDTMQQVLKCNHIFHITLSINSPDHTWCLIQMFNIQEYCFVDAFLQQKKNIYKQCRKMHVGMYNICTYTIKGGNLQSLH